MTRSRRTYFPPLWGDSTLSDGGHGHAQSVLVVGDQTDADLSRRTCSTKPPSFTAATRSPSLPSPVAGGSFVQPSGWTATSFFPLANNVGSRLPEIDLRRADTTQPGVRATFPGRTATKAIEWRDDLSWTKGLHQFKFGVQLAARLQEPATAGQHPRNCQFSTRARFPATRMSISCSATPASFEQLNYLCWQTLGQQQLWLLRQ